MHWMVAHVYVVLLGIVALAVIAGGLTITEPTRNTNSVSTWRREGGFTLVSQKPAAEDAQTPNPAIPQASGIAGDYSAIEIRRTVDTTSSTLPNEWESLLKQLVGPNDTTRASEAIQTDAYSFIPQGLISVTETATTRTAEQEDLYAYGNQVGVLISTFEDSHANMISILKDAYTDRNNAAKRSAAERIGTDYETLGKELAALSDIPKSVQPMHIAIAQSYQDAGKKMVAKLRTQTDDEFLIAMNAYNESALQFTRNFVTLATYLSAQGVRFSESDPGKVFTFTSY